MIHLKMSQKVINSVKKNRTERQRQGEACLLLELSEMLLTLTIHRMTWRFAKNGRLPTKI